jgi:hypothetical protein
VGPAYPQAVRRALVLFLATATVALPMLAAGVAYGAAPEGGTVVRVALTVNASNGLHAQLENSEDGTLTLELRRKNQLATYEVAGHATETGLKARFGRLGVIDVAFTPTKILNSTEPGEGCTGAPRTLREGVFTGTIHFTGERGDALIEDSRARGSMSVISQWECPEAEAMDPFAERPGRAKAAAASRDEGGKRRDTTLLAVRRGCSCEFIAELEQRHTGGRRIIFGGIQREQREGMKIFRSTSVRGAASSFVVDPGTGTVTLRPPNPLNGKATFEPGAHGRGVWRSTIQVPLLGADPIDTGASGFRALVVLG